MATIKGKTEAFKKYADISISSFDIVEKLCLEVIEVNNVKVQYLDLFLRTGKHTPILCLHIKFSDVRNLQLSRWGVGEIQLPGIEIIDVTKDQLEGLSWRVRDCEESMIDFYCNDIEIISIMEENRIKL